MHDENTIYKFRMVPTYEVYYNEEKSWGVYKFTSQDDIPKLETSKKNDFEPSEKSKFGTLTGRMQRLVLGIEYKVEAKMVYNQKYKQYQYAPNSIISVTPKSRQEQSVFLQAMPYINETISARLLDLYPNLVSDVAEGRITELDYSKVKGIGKSRWDAVKDKIIENYAMSDIIAMLQPYGITFNMIKKLHSYEPNPDLLKKRIKENPYLLTRVHGLGFKKVDELCLKLNPNLACSNYRLVSYIHYLLSDIGENEGHTWIYKEMLLSKISDNVGECIDLTDQLLESNTFLQRKNDQVGLSHMYKVERNIYEMLLRKVKYKNEFVFFTSEEIQCAITQSEKEQGFVYTEEQKRIITKALRSNVTIISGKAGTGKTTVSRAILKAYENKKYSIFAMALSAKAAQRISEATGLYATTIHRGLGAKSLTEFTYHKENTLPADVVFIDEASMINARLFYDLLCAVGKNTRLIISGDHQQLPPIGYGSVFADILFRNDVFNTSELTKVMRQAEKSGILVDANKIREGFNPLERPGMKIVHGELQDMCYMFRENREALFDCAVKSYLRAIETEGLDEVVIAVPRKQGCLNSTMEINKYIENKLFGHVKEKIETSTLTLHLGSKVIQTVNDYSNNVFNGEVGYVTSIYEEKQHGKLKKHCIVSFTDLVTGEKKHIEYSSENIEALDFAYAMTVHRLQGSGYKAVIGIIDATHYALLDSCMLYTMITRAKQKFLLLAEKEAYIRCIKNNNNIKRQTWLKELDSEEKKQDDVQQFDDKTLKYIRKERDRIVLAASSTFSNYKVFENKLKLYITENYMDEKCPKLKPVLVTNCEGSISHMVHHFGEVYGFKVLEIKANWETNGKSAGYINNQEILNFANEHENGNVVVFWDGDCKRTNHLIANAYKLKINTKIYDIEGNQVKYDET